jgi:prenylcysteine alpha-carboxyl methylesterase
VPGSRVVCPAPPYLTPLHSSLPQTFPILPCVHCPSPAGGAWTIGYRAWGALLARRLCEDGVLTACLDYRNFPQGSALDMLEDVNAGIAWVLNKAERFGGQPGRVWLVGQSAGGQLALRALLAQASQIVLGRPEPGAAPAWHPHALAGAVGVSGAYDLEGLAAHLHARGLYRSLLDAIMQIDGQVGCQCMYLYGVQ